MLVNGARQSSISLNNRGLAYGDGVFETIRLHNHQPVFLDLHLLRLQKGLKALGIPNCLPQINTDLSSLADDLPEKGVLKILLTRGAGGRGYRCAAETNPDRIMTLHALPSTLLDVSKGINVFVCNTRLADCSALSGLKHLNRLEQVLASMEWPDESFDEGLMLNTRGQAIEGTRSNLFVVIEGKLMTPSLERNGVDGVMRQVILKAFPETSVQTITMEQLKEADEVFFCNSVAGIWPVAQLHMAADDLLFSYKPGQWSERANTLFQQALDALK